ncbi:MAG: 50S ribosomal protein L9 [Candidatus Doudnabacteria bacterium]|nr:50S ribosomal protein L9 [Candidatus Doudnabacteria bacterium]
MKVILIKDVPGLGRAGDVKEVSDGHARNLLIPRNVALPATTSALTKIQKETAEQKEKLKRETENFIQLKNKFQNKAFTIKAKANKNSLFAGIHEKEIAKVINEKSAATIDMSMIRIKSPIKTLGEHLVEVRFAKDYSAMVKLVVVQE